jgi:hypothetical protein
MAMKNANVDTVNCFVMDALRSRVGSILFQFETVVTSIGN